MARARASSGPPAWAAAAAGAAADTARITAAAIRRISGAPELRIGLPPDPHHDLRQRLDVPERRPEVHDAGPERIAAVHHGIGDEGLPTPLEPVEDRLVEPVQVL